MRGSLGCFVRSLEGFGEESDRTFGIENAGQKGGYRSLACFVPISNNNFSTELELKKLPVGSFFS